MAVRCCGKKAELRTHDIPEHKTSDGTTIKAQKAVWYTCPNCGRTNSYSYSTEKEADEAWNKGLTGKTVK